MYKAIQTCFIPNGLKTFFILVTISKSVKLKVLNENKVKLVEIHRKYDSNSKCLKQLIPCYV